MEAKINLEDLSELLIGYAQWAMDRETFASYAASEMIKKYWEQLTISQQKALVKIIQSKYLEKWGSSNQEPNSKVWKELLFKLEKISL